MGSPLVQFLDQQFFEPWPVNDRVFGSREPGTTLRRRFDRDQLRARVSAVALVARVERRNDDRIVLLPLGRLRSLREFERGHVAAGQLDDESTLETRAEPVIDVTYIAESGEDAMENFARASPDLVLMDFRLPGMNGLETAKRMKKQRPDVKIAIVTAYYEQVLERMASEASVEDVIPKTEFGLSRVLRVLDRDQSAVGPASASG